MAAIHFYVGENNATPISNINIRKNIKIHGLKGVTTKAKLLIGERLFKLASFLSNIICIDCYFCNNFNSN